jgi:hypothetical protein
MLAAAGCASVQPPRPLAWDILPPAAPDPEKPPALVSAGDLVLAGQTVRTRSAFGLPLSIECEVWLQPDAAGEARFEIQFLPATATEPAPAPDRLVFAMTFLPPNISDAARPDAFSLRLHRDGSATERRWAREPFPVRPGRVYRLQISAWPDRVELQINHARFAVADFTVPADRFHIALSGQHSAHRWYVRNLLVR